MILVKTAVLAISKIKTILLKSELQIIFKDLKAKFFEN